MKYLLTLSFMAICALSVSAQVGSPQPYQVTNDSGITMEWKYTAYRFKENIKQNAGCSAEFTVTNTGKLPFTITEVKPGCSCSVAHYTKEPILPGQTGRVSGVFNAKSTGNFAKSFTVTVEGVDEQVKLYMMGKVVE